MNEWAERRVGCVLFAAAPQNMGWANLGWSPVSATQCDVSEILIFLCLSFLICSLGDTIGRPGKRSEIGDVLNQGYFISTQ